jgi:hypothetical protein
MFDLLLSMVVSASECRECNASARVSAAVAVHKGLLRNRTGEQSCAEKLCVPPRTLQPAVEVRQTHIRGRLFGSPASKCRSCR